MNGKIHTIRIVAYLSLFAALVGLFAPGTAVATNYAWTGTSSAAWGTAGNWSPSGPPTTGDVALLNGAGNGNTTIDVGSGNYIFGFIFDTASAAAYTIGTGAAGSQTLGLRNAGGATVLFTNTSTVVNNPVFNATLSFGNSVANASYLFENDSTASTWTFAGGMTSAFGGIRSITVQGAGNTIISGAIANNVIGTNNLTKTGMGTLTLSGANMFNGGLTINGGTVAISGSGTLGAATNAMTLGGGALDLGATIQTNAAVTISAAAASGDTIKNGTLTNTSLTVNNSSGTVTLSANIKSSGILTMSGAGTLTLSGNNLFTEASNPGSNIGALTVSAGILNLTGNNTITAGSSATQNGNLFSVVGGTLNLAGVNTLSSQNFGGAIVVTIGGVLKVNSIANNLQNATTINMGASSGNAGTFLYTGSGETTTLAFGSTSGSSNAKGIIDQSGTGLL